MAKSKRRYFEPKSKICSGWRTPTMEDLKYSTKVLADLLIDSTRLKITHAQRTLLSIITALHTKDRGKGRFQVWTTYLIHTIKMRDDTLYRNLQSLEECGLISTKKRGNKTVCTPNYKVADVRVRGGGTFIAAMFTVGKLPKPKNSDRQTVSSQAGNPSCHAPANRQGDDRQIVEHNNKNEYTKNEPRREKGPAQLWGTPFRDWGSEVTSIKQLYEIFKSVASQYELNVAPFDEKSFNFQISRVTVLEALQAARILFVCDEKAFDAGYPFHYFAKPLSYLVNQATYVKTTSGAKVRRSTSELVKEEINDALYALWRRETRRVNYLISKYGASQTVRAINVLHRKGRLTDEFRLEKYLLKERRSSK